MALEDGHVNTHLHSFESSFYVLSGEPVLYLDGRGVTLEPDACGAIPVGVSTPGGARDAREWIEVASPRPRGPDQPADTFFLGPPPDASPSRSTCATRATATSSISRRRHGRAEPEPGRGVGEPTVSASMATAALLYSGITVKMLVDKRLDAQLHTMFMVGYQPGAVAHPHDHPFEEAYYMLEGEVDVVGDGDRYTLRPGDFFWTGGRLRARVLRDPGRHGEVARDLRPRPARPALVSLRARLGVPRRAPQQRERSGRMTSPVGAVARLDHELYLDLYRRMRLIRGFEELVQSLFLRNEIYGTTHLYSGQEAVATGFASVLEERDRVAATYRGHGHALALGVEPQKLLDEMLGRSTGINGGRAGSMNITSPRDRLIGCFGIVGGSIAAATGAALALRRTGGVAVAYFGDGTMNQGYFFECLNFCKVMSLPLVLVCENNGYGEYTPFEDVTAGAIRARAEVMEVPAETIDGMSVWTVRETAQRALGHARSGGGPYFVEAITYRFVGHSRSDPGSLPPRASSTAGASAIRSSCSAPGSRRTACRRRALDEIEASVARGARPRWRSRGPRRRSPSRARSASSRPEPWRAS